MFDTPDIIRNFDEAIVDAVFEEIKKEPFLMLTGEGSSRFFPARNMISRRLQMQHGPTIISKSSFDLSGLDLSDFVIFGASNSGRTKEIVSLFMQLKEKGHKNLFGLTCNKNSLLEEYSKRTVVLEIGSETAVAATKSAVAQACFYELLLSRWAGVKVNKSSLAEDFEKTLNIPVAVEIIDAMAGADHIYFAGKNSGVAEELALKTPETVRKKSAFFPGTYLLHGVEEVISPKDVIILVDEFPDHQEKIKKIFVDGIGTMVVSISAEKSIFPNISLSMRDVFNNNYVRLAAGWRLLAETGLNLGINLDKPERARKIGNEMEIV